MLEFITFIPALELLLVNLIIINRCCSRKYSLLKTFSILIIFSGALFTFFYIFADKFSFHGNGTLSLFGFIFLIPFRYIYKEKTFLLFIVTCSCWIYTLGIFSFAIQLSGLLSMYQPICTIVIESMLYLLTLYLFYRRIIPKYIFVMENMTSIDPHWYHYIAINNCLHFLCLYLLNYISIQGSASPAKIITLLLFLASTYISFFIINKIVSDSLKRHQLESIVVQDPLTKLGNRSLLWDNLQRLIDNKQALPIIFMDLDRFKQINDRYGHVVGDQYLVHYAQVITHILGEAGTVFRFGGDEFVALYYGKAPQKIIQELQECREWDHGAPCPFNQVSIGTMFCSPPHPKAEDLLQQVDHLMYQNKEKKS